MRQAVFPTSALRELGRSPRAPTGDLPYVPGLSAVGRRVAGRAPRKESAVSVTGNELDGGVELRLPEAVPTGQRAASPDAAAQSRASAGIYRAVLRHPGTQPRLQAQLPIHPRALPAIRTNLHPKDREGKVESRVEADDEAVGGYWGKMSGVWRQTPKPTPSGSAADSRRAPPEEPLPNAIDDDESQRQSAHRAVTQQVVGQQRGRRASLNVPRK